MLLVAILFAGPLFEAGIVDGGVNEWIRGYHIREVLSSWIGYRNYVVVRIEYIRVIELDLHYYRAPSRKKSFGVAW